MRLSILVISYNTREMTLACLESVRSQAIDQDYEIIVVDNASCDGSAQAIAEKFPEIDLVSSRENLGFARANNLASERARGDYLLLLNPDTVVLDHAIDKLMTFAAQNPRARIWGGRTVFGDGSLNATSCWRHMTVWSLFCQAVGLAALFPDSAFLNWEAYGGWRRDTVRPVDIVTGCFLLITAAFWRELRGFDADFFMYAEECDLCIRAVEAGAAPLFTPEAEIVHYCGASEAVYSDKMVRNLKGKITLVNKHWSGLAGRIAPLLLSLQVLVRAQGYTASGALLRNADHRAKAKEWMEVWRRRREWMEGYAQYRGEAAVSSA